MGLAVINSVKAGWAEIVERPLAQGADVNAKARDAETPLMLAAKAGDVEITEVLLAKEVDQLDVLALLGPLLDHGRNQGIVGPHKGVLHQVPLTPREPRTEARLTIRYCLWVRTIFFSVPSVL
jgi:hypothetical protein